MSYSAILLWLYQSREKSIYKGLHPMSSGVVHHNINFLGKDDFGLALFRRLTEPAFLGNNRSRRSVTIQSSRISLLSRVVMGAGLLSTLWLGRQASECDPILHPPVCVWASLLIALQRCRPLSLLYHMSLIHSVEGKLGTLLDSAGTIPLNANKQRIARPHIKRLVWSPPSIVYKSLREGDTGID